MTLLPASAPRASSVGTRVHREPTAYRPLLDDRCRGSADLDGRSRCRSRPTDPTARSVQRGPARRGIPDGAGTICEAWRRVLHDVEAGRSTDASWRELVGVLHPLMLAWARHATLRRGQTEMDIEGIVQDAYVRLLGGNCLAMRRCRAHTERQIRAYLRCVCDNIATDRLRRVSCARRGGGRIVPVHEWTDETVWDDDPDACRRGGRALAPVHEAADPERRLLARCRLRSFESDLDECARVGRGGHRNAWIFRQAVLHGRRTNDIAAEVDLRPSSVDSVVGRMRRRLEERGWSFRRRT